MSRKLWKSFSWISSGWRRTLKLWRCGCSIANCSSFCRPFRELVNLTLLFAKAKVKPRVAAELFALLGVLVSSGPVCIFHLSFLKCLWGVCSYLLQNYIHLYANHLQKQWVIFLRWRYTNGGKISVLEFCSISQYPENTDTVKQGKIYHGSHHLCRLLVCQLLVASCW